MKKTILLFLLFSLHFLHAQDEVPWNEKPVYLMELNWILLDYEDQDSVGITRETALYRAFRLFEGDTFNHIRQLERRLEMGVEELDMRNLFKEIYYEVFYNEHPGYIEASVYVYVEDRWTIVAFPNFTYDTNLGRMYGGSIAYKNILGTLVDGKVTGFWSAEQWDITVEMANLDVAFFQGSLFYTQHYEEVYLYDTDENLETKYSFQTSHTRLRMDFPLTLGLNYFIMPGFLTTHSFDLIENLSGLEESDIENENTYYAAALFHGISYENIQWAGKMREGFSVIIENFLEVQIENELPRIDFDLKLNGYAHLGDFMGFSASVSGFYIFNSVRHNAGERLRGIEDHLVYGTWGAYVNSALAVQSFSIPPIIEFQLQPFMDWGYTVNPGEELGELDNYYLTGGFSLLCFPLFVRNLQFSAILGYNLLEPGPYELSLYSGLFF